MNAPVRPMPKDLTRAGPAPGPRTLRYFAFLSYSHRDEALADWLHRALEKYDVPAGLVGRTTDNGVIPKRLTPIFRDRSELAASGDLGSEIRSALGESRFLIVLCSPAAATSKWTNEEIASFKRLRPDGCVLAAIVGGEPFASDLPGREAEECFPAALRHKFDRRGRATRQRAEPIAADLRQGKDGRRLGLLKIIAGMLDVGLDELVQRETQRRQRRWAWIAAAALGGMAVTSTLAVTAIQARDEARDQRREAEGLVGFMLGDLRGKLEPIGRLDALDAVGARALAYFEAQTKADLSDAALAQRSRALTMMGEIAEARGDLDGALRRYREALAGTAEALRRFPADPQRLFDHAQNVYWVGSIALQRGKIDEAAAQFAEYQALAKRMIAADPGNGKWQLEGVYAATNLGTVQMEQRRYGEAAATFQASLGATEMLAASDPRNLDYPKLLLETLAWLGDAYERSGKLDLAVTQRERQIGLLQPYLARDRPDADFRRKAMIAHMALSRHLFERSDTPAALRHAAEATRIGQRLTELEPGNADWMGSSADAHLNLGLLQLRAGRVEEAGGSIRAGCDLVNRVTARDRSVVFWRASNRLCLGLRAELAMAEGARDEAKYLARQALDAARAERTADPLDDRSAVASALKLVGDMAWQAGDRDAARDAWRAGLANWPRNITETPLQMAERGAMLRGLGDKTQAERLATTLAAMGYRQSLGTRVRN